MLVVFLNKVVILAICNNYKFLGGWFWITLLSFPSLGLGAYAFDTCLGVGQDDREWGVNERLQWKFSAYWHCYLVICGEKIWGLMATFDWYIMVSEEEKRDTNFNDKS